MANEVVPNYTLAASGDTFSAVWKLTRAMKKAGWTYLASSDGTTTETAGVATNDKWGGNADPLLDSYPALGAGAWILMQGPSTLKIPIGNVVPTGNFLRGEKITQAVTGAEGEILGIVTDAGSNGYLVVAPRTGTFNGTNQITGAYSAATITPPTTTVVTFVRQMVLWRSSITAGHAYYQCVDNVGEATSRFSDATRMAAVTATICPGGGSSGDNSFPSIGTMAMIGTGGSGAVGTGSKAWLHSDITATEIGKAQIMVANNTPAADISADGSWTIVYGTPVLDSGSFIGFGFMRLDDQEDGDVDPYVSFNPNANTVYSGSRTAVTSVLTSASGSFDVARQFFTANAAVCNTQASKSGFGQQNIACWRGFRRRGLSSETFQEFVGHFLSSFNGTDIVAPGTYNDAPLFANVSSNDAVATAPVVSRVREPIWIISTQTNQKMRKGTVRWWYIVQGGAGCDTFDNKKWVQLGSSRNLAGTFFRGPIAAGPWDGTTTPTNA